MSKAFTKDDSDTAEVVPQFQLAPGERRLVTWDGYRAMQAELARLLDTERARLTGPGLESQNALKALDTRVASLQARISAATPADIPDDTSRVFFGAHVVLRDARGKVKRWRIVGPDEVDPLKGNISVGSPLARALLGKTVGDEVDVELPRGDETVTITDISYG